MKNPPLSQLSSKTNGVALVIVLSLVVLLTILVTAFFSRAILNQQISNSSAGQTKADNVAQSAMAYISSDLRQEINAGSKADSNPAGTTYTVNGIRIFVPKTNKSAVPARIGTNDVLPNLTRRSVRSDTAAVDNFPSQSTIFPVADYDATLLPKNRASASSTTTTSQNQRIISIDRWNKPLLLSGGALPTQFAAPDWVILTRNGPKPFSAWDATLKDATLNNKDFAIGRYAYTVYDEGGLLDINQAGYPASLNSDNDFKAKRGRLGQVNLNDIPGITNGNALVAWRNSQTGLTASAYRSYLFDNTPKNEGFLKTLPNDQTFISRQDLLNYQKINPAVLTAGALQYLATFTREKNAPAYNPDPVRPKVQPGKAAANSFGAGPPGNPDYGVSIDPGNPNTFGDDDLFNPSLINTRDTSGQSLFSRRFPLSRLSMLTAFGPATGANPADILKYFGLVWDASTGAWIYTSPDGNLGKPIDKIKFLKNIPTGRQPDFFETLQAAISIGSLGRDSDGQQDYKASYEAGTSSSAFSESQNTYFHVMRIGANIIDQSDSDNYPTLIMFAGKSPTVETIAGIENLPYLSRVFDNIYQDSVTPSLVIGAYEFEVWNPHQDNSNGGASPSQFRIAGLDPGSAQLIVLDNGGGYHYATSYSNSALPPLTFAASSSDYHTPTLLSGSFAVGNINQVDRYGAFLWGSTTFSLQYKGPDGNWREYQKLRRLGYQLKPSEWKGSGFDKWYHQRIDPRTDRFGTSMNFLSVTRDNSTPDPNFKIPTPYNSTIRPDGSPGYYLSENTPKNAAIFRFQAGGGPDNAARNSTLGVLSDNTSSGIYYLDPDGQQRPADGAYRTGFGTDGQPLGQNNFPSQPVIINRPFRSVGELGYVFRDVPWKTLDFYNSNSGDAALLDAFSIDDADNVAGHVNINTRQTTVLSAILSGAAKLENDPTKTINSNSSTEAQNLATSLTNLTTTAPIMNRSELVTRFGQNLTYIPSSNLSILTQRGTAIRALAELANTRTWNLLIDVVAQSGKYPASATGLANFIVEGERRYWLHVAIDRYTGQVIDQTMELVNE